MLHGAENRTTDIDFAVSMDDANLSRLADALEELHAKPKRWQTSNYRLERQDFYTGWIHLESDAGDIDILARTPGQTFEEIVADSEKLSFERASVLVASIRALKAMKSETGRDRDAVHLHMLEQVERAKTLPPT